MARTTAPPTPPASPATSRASAPRAPSKGGGAGKARGAGGSTWTVYTLTAHKGNDKKGFAKKGEPGDRYMSVKAAKEFCELHNLSGFTYSTKSGAAYPHTQICHEKIKPNKQTALYLLSQ